MSTVSPKAGLEARMRALIDDQVMAAYWDSVAHFNSTDLVLWFDERETSTPLAAQIRKLFIAKPDLPGPVRARLAQPAHALSPPRAPEDCAFWFVLVVDEAQMACCIVHAHHIGPVGHA